MRVDDFDFDLPDERIALRPVTPRDASRLLLVDGPSATIRDQQFTDIVTHLNQGDVLVINQTKVFPAALTGYRPAHHLSVEQKPVKIDFNLHQKTAHQEAGKTQWRAFARPAKKATVGSIITFADGFTALVEARDGAEVLLSFPYTEDVFFQKIHQDGNIPLPPYIGRQRDLDAQDKIDYQTVFASVEGSVAAPTAGLHFTPDVMQALEDKGIEIAIVTLHVGAGTFLPVTAEDTKDHKMHAEWGDVTAATAAKINNAKQNGGRIIAVGTTSMRLLETVADDSGKIHPYTDETDIFITPGYQFKAIDGLVTNFHLPKSTLFMLVSAFAGKDTMKRAYQHAIDNEYRFYSYGDSSLLWRA